MSARIKIVLLSLVLLALPVSAGAATVTIVNTDGPGWFAGYYGDPDATESRLRDVRMVKSMTIDAPDFRINPIGDQDAE